MRARQLRNDGTFADGRHRNLHASPCEAWGRKARLGDATWEGPVLAQVAGIAVDDVTLASVVAALGSSHRPVAIDRARIDRQIHELALEHAAGGLGDETYLTRLKALREARDAITERSAAGLPGHRAVERLRALSESIQIADVPKENGAPDRCWTRDCNLQHAHRGQGRMARRCGEAAQLVGIRPGTVKRHLADLRARPGLAP